MPLNKMTKEEFAEFLCDRLSSREGFTFLDAPDLKTGSEYCCAGTLIAGRFAILANRQGGGYPFCYEAPYSSEFKVSAFVKAFCQYLDEAGVKDYVWVDPEPVCRFQLPKRPPSVPMSLEAFASLVWENAGERRYYTFTKEEEHPEIYSIQIRSVAGSEMLLCSANAAGTFFWCELNTKTAAGERGRFIKHLDSQGFSTVFLRT